MSRPSMPASSPGRADPISDSADLPTPAGLAARVTDPVPAPADVVSDPVDPIPPLVDPIPDSGDPPSEPAGPTRDSGDPVSVLAGVIPNGVALTSESNDLMCGSAALLVELADPTSDAVISGPGACAPGGEAWPSFSAPGGEAWLSPRVSSTSPRPALLDSCSKPSSVANAEERSMPCK